MSDIFREVDEALQQERVEKLWKEHNTSIILLVVTLLIATAGFSAYTAWNNWRDQAETSTLIMAMEQDNAAEALQKLAGDSRKGQQTVAVLAAGGKHLENGEFEEALAVYENALNQGQVTKDFEGLIRILATRLYYTREDENSADKMMALLKPVLDSKNNPWLHHAHAEAALIKAHYSQDYDAALDHLEAIITSDTALPALQERAKAMKHVYVIQKSKTAQEG